MLSIVDRHVIARESNIVRVDFSREPDPPAPCFPGANGLRLSDTETDDAEAPTDNLVLRRVFLGNQHGWKEPRSVCPSLGPVRRSK